MPFTRREAGKEGSDEFSVRDSVSKSQIYAFERVVCVSQIEEVINDFVQPTSNAQSTSRRNNDVRQDLIARRAVHQAELKRLNEEIRAIEDLRKQQIQSIKDITHHIDALD